MSAYFLETSRVVVGSVGFSGRCREPGFPAGVWGVPRIISPSPFIMVRERGIEGVRVLRSECYRSTLRHRSRSCQQDLIGSGMLSYLVYTRLTVPS